MCAPPRRRTRSVLVEETVDLTHTVLADRKACIRIVDRHIVLIAHVDDALAEAALMLYRIFRHINFLSGDVFLG